jgi:branched-chain amino acid aminotransferase
MGLSAVHNDPSRDHRWPWGAYLGEEGSRAFVCDIFVPAAHVNTLMTKAKTAGNYVNSIGESEAKSGGSTKPCCWIPRLRRRVQRENIFIVRAGRIKKPLRPQFCRYHRDTVLTLLARRGGDRGDALQPREAYLADEVFMTGTAAEVTPVREIDGRTIGEGQPGPLTQALQQQYAAIVRGQDDQYRHWLTPVV